MASQIAQKKSKSMYSVQFNRHDSVSEFTPFMDEAWGVIEAFGPT
jgi:hypothetical protein